LLSVASLAQCRATSAEDRSTSQSFGGMEALRPNSTAAMNLWARAWVMPGMEASSPARRDGREWEDPMLDRTRLARSGWFAFLVPPRTMASNSASVMTAGP